MNTHAEKGHEQSSKAIAHQLQKKSGADKTVSQLAAANLFTPQPAGSGPVIQRTVYENMHDMWAEVAPHIRSKDVREIISQDSAMQAAYFDCASRLDRMDFIYEKDAQPEAAIHPDGNDRYRIVYGRQGEQGKEDIRDIDSRFVGSILHEMMHVAAALQYNTNVAPGPDAQAHMANMHLPVSDGTPVNAPYGASDNQMIAMNRQRAIMSDNWEIFLNKATTDRQNADLSADQFEILSSRRAYAGSVLGSASHYETVLFDILYYLVSERATDTLAYEYAHRMMDEANARRRSGFGTVARIASQEPDEDDEDEGCFITTACVKHMGLPDDCEELMLLRKFRDEYLLHLPNGKALFGLYYEHSPAILDGIRRREDEDEILRRLYKIISKCADAVRDGNNEFALETYCRMMLELKKEFIPDLELRAENLELRV